jgi:hypothetical protein
MMMGIIMIEWSPNPKAGVSVQAISSESVLATLKVELQKLQLAVAARKLQFS